MAAMSRPECTDRVSLGGGSRSAAGARGRSGSSSVRRDRSRRKRGSSAAKTATATIPIVFATGDDPVEVGLVASLNQPGGNVTGVYFYSGAELQSKQLELLHELVPSAVLIGVLVNPRSPQGESQARNVQVAARGLGASIVILNASSQDDFDAAFATLAQQRVGALLIAGDAFFTGQSIGSSRWPSGKGFPRSTASENSPLPAV